MSNYIHYKVWVEITYPFQNLNGCTVAPLTEYKSNLQTMQYLEESQYEKKNNTEKYDEDTGHANITKGIAMDFPFTL